MKIKKLFATLGIVVCMAFCMMFGMGNAMVANAAEVIPEYTFTEDNISYCLELTDEDDFKLTANNNGSEATVTGKYTLEEDVITLVVAGNEFAQFKLNEDMSMELVIEEEVEETPSGEIKVPTTVEDYKAQVEELTALIEQLHTELNKEEVNYEEVGKIAVAILGIVGLIILGLLIVIIRLKIKNINKDKLYQDVREATDKVFADYQKEVKDLIEDVKVTVTKKIDDNEEKRQAEAEAQSIKLRASVEAAKANLSINSVLDD